MINCDREVSADGTAIKVEREDVIPMSQSSLLQFETLFLPALPCLESKPKEHLPSCGYDLRHPRLPVALPPPKTEISTPGVGIKRGRGRPKGRLQTPRTKAGPAKPAKKPRVLSKGSGPEQCPMCHKSFATPRNVRRHLYRKHKLRSWRLLCGFCSHGFRHKASLELHMLERHLTLSKAERHHNHCRLCPAAFASAKGLVRHVQVLHASNPQPFTCALCLSSYRTKNAVALHVKNFHVRPRKKPKCRLCGRGFVLKCEQRRHERTGECVSRSPVSCYVCGAAYKNDNVLQHHLWQRHGSRAGRRFECDQCPVTYVAKSDLEKHRRCKHVEGGVTRDVPPRHKCDTCGKSFQLKKVLSTHFKFCHFGLPRYQCRLCHKSYCRPHHLKRHLREFHDVTTGFCQCEHCSLVCPNKGALLLHLAHAHARKPRVRTRKVTP